VFCFGKAKAPTSGGRRCEKGRFASPVLEQVELQTSGADDDEAVLQTDGLIVGKEGGAEDLFVVARVHIRRLADGICKQTHASILSRLEGRGVDVDRGEGDAFIVATGIPERPVGIGGLPRKCVGFTEEGADADFFFELLLCLLQVVLEGLHVSASRIRHGVFAHAETILDDGPDEQLSIDDRIGNGDGPTTTALTVEDGRVAIAFTLHETEGHAPERLARTVQLQEHVLSGHARACHSRTDPTRDRVPPEPGEARCRYHPHSDSCISPVLAKMSKREE
jgi:hypothetical protein